jgi:3-hydroxyisobutyrate dehydrogenase-like beta-hydroxyacid dehydrogenase
MRVAILGTGRMGSAMARALAAAGFELLLYNRSARRAQDLAAALGSSAETAATASDAARGGDVVISMVSDGAAVEELYTGPLGLIAGLRPGSVVLEMSTVPPSVSRGLEARVRATGAGLIDAPVSGSVALAESGQLTIMAGGDAVDLVRARTVLDALGKRVFHLGPLGSGAVMKLAVNNIIMGLNGALAESLVLAERAGVDRATAYEVFASSAAGAPFVLYKRAAFVEPETTPPAFALELAAKDLRLILELGEQVGVRLPQAATNLVQVQAAASRDPGADLASVAEMLRGAATPDGPS